MTVAANQHQEMIEQSQALLRSVATKIHSKLPRHVELDDLIAYGQIGLAQAARDFDVSQGARFSTYAYYRIRGAIYDGISKISWTSRSRYNRIRYEQQAGELLEEENGAARSQEESARAESEWMLRVTRQLAVVYLSTHADIRDSDASTQIRDSAAIPPSSAVADQEIYQRLHELIDELPEDAAQLIRCTYFEGMTLQEAGKRLGFSKSWASRLHARTLDQLARALRRIGAGE